MPAPVMNAKSRRRNRLKILKGPFRITGTEPALMYIVRPTIAAIDRRPVDGNVFERESDGSRWRVRGVDIFAPGPDLGVMFIPCDADADIELQEGDILDEVIED